MTDLTGLQRPTRPSNEEPSLFGESFHAPPWQSLWWGMPSFVMGDATPQYRITINCLTWEDVQELGRRLGFAVTQNTDTAWFPRQDLDEPKAWAYVED